MATQYTSILKLALPVQGELSGTWGDVVNDNITSMVEEAIAGRAVINTWTANSHTLTTADGTTSESRAAILTLTDTGTALTGAGTVICPAASKIYIVENGTGQTITVKTASGTGIAVPNTKNMVVFCDGTNVEEGITNINSLTLNGDGATVSSIKDEDNMASDSATALATQQSIKAYVDSQVGANNELSEVLANGNTTGGTDISVSSGDDITFADSSKAIFGAGSDLQLYHDGGTSFIDDVGTGNLHIRTDGASIKLRTSANADMIVAENGGAAKLYHAGSQKLATLSTGIDVTGTVTADGLTVNSGAENLVATFQSTDTEAQIALVDTTGTSTIRARNDFRFHVNNAATPALKIDSNNDISFYEDTGTTAKLFWDASTERLELSNLKLYSDNVRNEGGILYIGTSGNNATQFYNNDANTVHISGAGNVGIGTSSPLQALHVSSGTGNSAAIFESTDSTSQIWLKDSASSSTYQTGIGCFGDNLLFNNGGERMRIDSSGRLLVGLTGASGFGTVETDTLTTTGQCILARTGGNVGIGTSSPREKMHLHGGTSSTQLLMTGGGLNSEIYGGFIEGDGVSGQGGHLRLGVLDAGTERVGIEIEEQGNQITFDTAGTERLRIDSSGNLLVGNTVTDPATSNVNGVAITAGGEVIASLNGVAAQFNRRISDGDVAVFKKGGDTKGSIGVLSNRLYIGSGDTGIKFSGADDLISPIDASDGTGRDAAIDLGSSGARFKDLYLSGTGYFGTSVGIGTSSPAFALDVNHPSDNGLARFTSGDADAYITISDVNSSSAYNKIGVITHDMYFNTNNAERMRIDASGNLLVGTTDDVVQTNSGTGNGGIVLRNNNYVAVASDGSAALELNRLASDGEIANFRKDGTTVGSIATVGGNRIAIGSSDVGLFFDSIGNELEPWSLDTGAVRDAAINIGRSGGRFKDLFLSGGVYLGGTGSANYLDDYEEGTFSGTVQGSVYSGTYTKVGRICHISLDVDNTNSTSTQIASLPFSSKNGGTSINGSQPTFNTSNANADVFVAPYNGGSAVFLYTRTGTTQNVSTGTIIVNFVYETD